MSEQPTSPIRATSPGSAQLELAAERGSITLLPGSQHGLTLTLRNAGGSPLSVELIAQGPPANWLSLSPEAFVLAPAQTAPGTLTLSPPAEAPPGNYPITLVAQARDLPTVTVRLDLMLEIAEPGRITVQLTPSQAEGQAMAEFQVQVVQSSLTALRVSLSASDSEGACSYTFDPATLLLLPAEAATSRLTVRTRRALVGGDSQPVPFTVTATALEGTAVAGQAQGRFIQRRLPPVQLSLIPTKQSGPDQATYTVRIANPSQMEATFRLSASDPEGACRYQFTPNTLTVAASGEAQATLVVAPLQYRTETGEQAHTFTVRAEPAGEWFSPAQVEGQFVQTAMEPLRLALTPSSQSTSGSATFTLQVTNPRPTPLDIQFRAYDAGGLCAFAFAPPRLRLSPGSEAAVRLTVRPTSRLLPGESRRNCPFSVEAQLADQPKPVVVEGSLIQMPGRSLPRPVLIAGLVVVLLGLCAFLAWSGLRAGSGTLCHSLGLFCPPAPPPVAVEATEVPPPPPPPVSEATEVPPPPPPPEPTEVPTPPPPPPPQGCPDTIPTRLHPDMMAYVSFDPPLRNIVRAEPNPTAEEVGRLDPGTKVQILEGPVCSDGIIYWRVHSETGLEGWTGEGNKDTYWLVPGEPPR